MKAGQPILMHDLLTRQQRSVSTAIQTGESCQTYRELYNAARRCESALLALGIMPHDRVAIYLPKGAEECCCLFGASYAGAVFVPINPILMPAQIAHIISDSEASVIITSSALWSTVSDSIKTYANVPRVLTLDDIGLSSPASVSPLNSPKPTVAPLIGEDLAAILYTSGSTGRPKGVMLSHSNLLAGSRIVRQYLDITKKDRLLSVLPLSFDYGLNQLLTVVEQGACLIPFSFRFGNELAHALEHYEISGFAGVPTIWSILTERTPNFQRLALPRLRYITNSGGAVPSHTVAKLRERLPGTDIFLMYGLTEAFRSTYLDPREIQERPTSIGKPIPESDVFVLTPDGRRAGPGETGVLVHRGPTVSRGYWRRPEATEQVIVPNPLRESDRGGELVCLSGDLATTDEQGFLYFVGRNDSLIKSSGYRISPTDVEEALMNTGLFRQVAVIGLPDPSIGQVVHAIAELATTAPKDGVGVEPKALAECAKSLPGYMVPRRVEIVANLPSGANGKVDYQVLKAQRTQVNKSPIENSQPDRLGKS